MLSARPLLTVVGLGEDAVDLWFLRRNNSFDTSSEATLSSDDRLRAVRVRAPSVARTRATHRASVRQILSGYTGESSRRLTFDTVCRHCGDRRHGKPRLLHYPKLAFSISHCGGALLVAVARAGEVGVDLEMDGSTVTGLDTELCAPSERLWLSTGQDHDRTLIHLWTRKEAVLKAAGLGLAASPKAVCITSLQNNWSPVTLHGQTWWVTEPELDPTVVAAVARDRLRQADC